MKKKAENNIDITKTILNYKKIILDQHKEIEKYQKENIEKGIKIQKLTTENNKLKTTIEEFSNNLGAYLMTEENMRYVEKGKAMENKKKMVHDLIFLFASLGLLLLGLTLKLTK